MAKIRSDNYTTVWLDKDTRGRIKALAGDLSTTNYIRDLSLALSNDTDLAEIKELSMVPLKKTLLDICERLERIEQGLTRQYAWLRDLQYQICQAAATTGLIVSGLDQTVCPGLSDMVQTQGPDQADWLWREFCKKQGWVEVIDHEA